MGSNSGRGTGLEVFIYRSISPPAALGAWYQDTTIQAHGQSCIYGVKNRLGINKIIPKHLIKSFIVAMRNVVVRLAKYNVYRYMRVWM